MKFNWFKKSKIEPFNPKLVKPISIQEWEMGLLYWKNIHTQAVKDLEQTELIIPVIEKKIRELKEAQGEQNGE